MNRDQALKRLRDLLAKVSPDSPDKLFQLAARIRDAKSVVIDRYGPIFSPEGLIKLTAEEFKGFLLFRNNGHWDGLHRQGGWMTEDMNLLREALSILADEGMPIAKRLNLLRPKKGKPMVKGLGRAVITAILQILAPNKYGVLNNTARRGMLELDLFPSMSRGAVLVDLCESSLDIESAGLAARIRASLPPSAAWSQRSSPRLHRQFPRIESAPISRCGAGRSRRTALQRGV